MKATFILCISMLFTMLFAAAQVTQINSNQSLRVIFPVSNTKTIIVSDVDSSVWVSDATLAGTVQVSTIKYEGPSVLLAGKLIFRGKTAATGSELFITDGTPGGTTLLKDIYSGSTGSLPAELVTMGGFIYFTAATAAEGRELWKTDGTEPGTALVKDIVTGPDSSNMIDNYQLYSNGTYLLFAAKTPASGIELWKSDGTGPGTVLLKDINTGHAGADSSNPAFFYRINSLVVFIATDAVNGREFWRTDGTAIGTTLLKDINAGPGSSTELELIPGFEFPVFKGFHTFNGNVYFNAFDGSSTGQVWKSDGNTANTSLLKDVVPGFDLSLVLVIDAVNYPAKFFFPVSDNSSTSELWQSDGTPGGTVLFKSFTHVNVGDVPFLFVPYNFDILNASITQPLFQGNKFFFSAATATEGNELWISDGTLPGTVMVKDIFSGTSNGIDLSSRLTYLYTSTDFFFNGNTSTQGNELWKSDGTTVGTTIVQDIYLNANDADPELNFITNGTKIIFSATDGNNLNGDLFVVDGNFLPLPVKVLNFTVALKQADAILNWSTSQEINSRNFSIQRSFNGVDFNDIGTVAASGYAEQQEDYAFTDRGIAYCDKQVVYYRLLLSDKDGKINRSTVISLRLRKTNDWNVQLLTNPVHNDFRLLVNGDPGRLQLSIVDEGGRRLYHQSFQNLSGEVSFPVNFGAGTYLLIAERNGMRKVIKMVKL